MTVNKLDRLILEDLRIRRILTANEKLIKDTERKNGVIKFDQFHAYTKYINLYNINKQMLHNGRY